MTPSTPMAPLKPRLGLCFDARNPAPFARPGAQVYGRILELAEEAERRNLGMLWFSEHHQFEDGYLPQPLTLAAAVAARTSRIRLGTAVLIAPLHHPQHLAEQAVVVDLISNGRLELGLGAGYRAAEFDLFAADHGTRFSATVAVAEAVRRRWTTDLLPRPVQRELPLWFGFNGPRGAAAAARLGGGLITTEPDLAGQYLEQWDLAENAAPPRLAAMVRLLLSDDPERTWARLAPHVLWQWDSYRRAALEGSGKTPRPLDASRVVALGDDLFTTEGLDGISSHRLDRIRFGVATPDEARAVLAAVSGELPVTDVLTFGWVAGAPDDLADTHLELLAELITDNTEER